MGLGPRVAVWGLRLHPPLLWEWRLGLGRDGVGWGLVGAWCEGVVHYSAALGGAGQSGMRCDGCVRHQQTEGRARRHVTRKQGPFREVTEGRSSISVRPALPSGGSNARPANRHRCAAAHLTPIHLTTRTTSADSNTSTPIHFLYLTQPSSSLRPSRHPVLQTSGQRPRSATPSRGASPARSRRSSGHGAGGGTSGSHHSDRAQSASSQRRRRSSSDNVADPGSQPPAASAGSASAALASTISRRNKRASAPGEIFFSVGSGSAADVPSPPQGTRPGSAVAAARDGITKGKNWLARLSRGLTTASSGHGSSAAGVTPPRPATAHPAGGGGGGGGSARSSSPLPPVAAGAVVAEAPRSPHHHSGPVGRALGLFARRSDPPAAGASAAGGPEPAKSAKARAQQSGPATAAAAAALADDDDDDTTAADETGGPGAGTLAEAAGGSPTAASVPVPAMP